MRVMGESGESFALKSFFPLVNFHVLLYDLKNINIVSKKKVGLRI